MQASVCIPVNDNVHLSCRLYHSCYCSTIKISKVCGDERWEQLRLHGQHAMTCCCFFLESWVDLLLWGISWVTDCFVVIFRGKQKNQSWRMWDHDLPHAKHSTLEPEQFITRPMSGSYFFVMYQPVLSSSYMCICTLAWLINYIVCLVSFFK